MSSLPSFDGPDLLRRLDAMSDAELDDLDFGVIGFDAAGVVRRYGAHESRASGLSPQRVLGLSLFNEVAVCMNNYLVAQRFEDAVADGSELDATIDYVLTLRMRPVKVRLSLLAAPWTSGRCVAIDRRR